MSRTSLGIVTTLVILGCVVALLPAQESSRRTASKYKPGPTTTGERPSLTPITPSADAELPPIVSPPGRTAPSPLRSQFAPVGQSTESVSPAAETTNSILPRDPTSSQSASEYTPQAGTATTSETEDSRLHSVLKRPRTQPAETPALLPPPTSASVAAPPAAITPAPSTTTPGELPRRSSQSNATATSPTNSTRSSAATNNSSLRPAQNTAATSKSAALKVEIAGPPGVTVGKAAPYTVTVTNESDTAADEVQLRMALPTFVTVQSTQPTSGDAAMQGDAQGAARLVWTVPRVGPRSREQLSLQILTREGDAFDLGVEWITKPAVARAAIVVKQPQLALSLAGPADMTFGEEKTFILTVSNPGTGDAEHVTISVNSANSPPQQFDAGVVPAGHMKEVPLAVVASQAGTIELQVGASAEGGLEARTTGKITVRKAEVNVAIEGPPQKFAGSEAIYDLAVTNTGSATADNVNLSISLPSGAKYLGGIEGATANAAGVKWKIATLGPGAERLYEVRLQLSAPGTNRVNVQSQAASSGTANCVAETEVEAVSDLKLVVHDPSGPVSTGEPAVYELQVMNRGSQAAKQVKVVMQFSEGVEPLSFEGCDAQIVPGQVLCRPLAQLGPGEQATVRVKAKAQNAGSHMFRVEVTTTDGDARLVSEGTTRFFAETGRSGAAASTARKPSLVPGPSIPTTIR